MTESSSPPSGPSERTRAIVSLLLFIHLFCVFAALAANFRRSPLLDRLVTKLAPYLKTTNFDPDFTRFHLVQNAAMDDERYFEVELLQDSAASESESNPVVTLPEDGFRGGLAYRRFLSVAYLMGMLSAPEVENDVSDALKGVLAKSIGARVMREKNVKRVVVRCKYHMSQPLVLSDLRPGFPADPKDPRYEVTLYEADVWTDEDGKVLVNKRTAAAEAAIVELPSASQSPKTTRGVKSGASSKSSRSPVKKTTEQDSGRNPSATPGGNEVTRPPPRPSFTPQRDRPR